MRKDRALMLKHWCGYREHKLQQNVCVCVRERTKNEWARENGVSVSNISSTRTRVYISFNAYRWCVRGTHARTHPSISFNLTRCFSSNVIIRFFNFADATIFAFFFFFFFYFCPEHNNCSFVIVAFPPAPPPPAAATADIVHLPFTHVNLYQMNGMVSFGGSTLCTRA